LDPIGQIYVGRVVIRPGLALEVFLAMLAAWILDFNVSWRRSADPGEISAAKPIRRPSRRIWNVTGVTWNNDLVNQWC
jgi:hypothetical protein